MLGSCLRRRAWLAGLLPFLLLGCQTHKDYTEPSGSALATQPTGRDLDLEQVDANRRLSSMSKTTIRIYEYPDGRLVLDERLTFADRQRLLQYLEQMDPRHLSQGIVYFINSGSVQDKQSFAAVKAFCIRHNVNLYVGEGSWARRRPTWDVLSLPEEATWVIKSRP
jgi:hypothetical protein